MMENSLSYISENYKMILEKIENASVKAGINRDSITLLGASKTVEPEIINYAISCGLKAIGENRVQELMDKYDNLNLSDCDSQFIGQLQTNKIKYLVGKVSQIQSIDNIGQIKELSHRLEKTGETMKILIEVNIGSEKNKGGVTTDKLYEFIDEAREYKGVKINGLMAIPPVYGNNALLCRHFSQMNKDFIDIGAKKMDNVNMGILSMGMSHDFVDAILCGANMIRIGSLLFGKRIY